jgi:hypothetical protein
MAANAQPPQMPKANAPRNEEGDAFLWACDQRDPRTLLPGLVNDGENLRFLNGLPETRQGVAKPGWANRALANRPAPEAPAHGVTPPGSAPAQPVPPPGGAPVQAFGAPYGAGAFRDPDGVEWELVAANGYVYCTRPGNGAQTLPLPPGVKILGRCRFVQAFNQVYLFRGRYLPPLLLGELDTGFEDLLAHWDAATAYQAAVTALGTTAEEMAYGPFHAVTSVTRALNTVTVVTATAHGYATGQDVTLAGASPAAYNGRWNITVLDETTFAFALFTAATTPATGVITCSDMSRYWRALGSQAQMTSLTHSGLTATATKPAHGFSNGQTVVIAGATPAPYNGAFTISGVTANTFQYTMLTDPGNDAAGNPVKGSGTITAAVSVTVTALTHVGTTAMATAAGHKFQNGQSVTISGATVMGYNGTFAIGNVATNTFQYTLAADPGVDADLMVAMVNSAHAGVSITALAAPMVPALLLAQDLSAVLGNFVPGYVADKGWLVLILLATPALTSGQQVVVKGANPDYYNGTFTVEGGGVRGAYYVYLYYLAVKPAVQNLNMTSCTVNGPALTITSLTHSTTTATATCAGHGFSNGQSVVIANAVPASYNGTYQVQNAMPNTFQYVMSADPGADAMVVTLPLPTLTNVTITHSGTTATATYASHGLQNGQSVIMAGATPGAYNGTFVISGVAADTFQYTMLTTPAANASGSITAQAFVVLTAITREISSGVLTGTATSATHGLSNGAQVSIQGASPAGYNNTYVILNVATNTFDFILTADPGANASVGSMGAVYESDLFILTHSGTTATATAPAHGYSNGDYVIISGATPAGYNGTFAIQNVTANTFDFILPADPGADGSGVVLATHETVLAGQSPDSNPAAWQRIYNVLPNASTALFINNMLLVPTAYQPASADNYKTFNGGGFFKTDYLVATNYQDNIHFDFVDEFRINEGSDDEIVDLWKTGPDSLIVFKGKSWGNLRNVSGDLSAVRFDLRSTQYGLAAAGACCGTGSDVVFMAPGHGVATVRTSEQGELISADVPLSAPIVKTMARINWQAAGAMRMSNLNNRVYIGVPLDNSPVANAVLVFDFVAASKNNDPTQQNLVSGMPRQGTMGWTPLDTGGAMTPVEWFKLTLNGELRLFFLDKDGWVNLMEEWDGADQTGDASSESGLGEEAIYTRSLSRAYRNSFDGLEKPVELAVGLETWDPRYDIALIFNPAFATRTLVSGQTRDNTKYFRPYGKADWDPGNANDDHATVDRQDYSVRLPGLGAMPDPVVNDGLNYTWTITVEPGIAYVLNLTTDIYWVLQIGQVVNGVWVTCQQPTLTPGTPQTIRSIGNTFLLTYTKYGYAPAAPPSLTCPGLNLGANGIELRRHQETLRTCRISGRQGRSFQVETINDQGRLRVLGMRVTAVPGRNRRGEQL